MPTPTLRTATHSCPQEEINAMKHFYGGKRCFLTRVDHSVEWAHCLDAALEASNERVSKSLVFCAMVLKVLLLAFSNAFSQAASEKHPKHPAEVRENLIPRTSFFLFNSVDF